MRRFFFNRWTVIALLLLGLLFLYEGDRNGAKVDFILSALTWLFAGCPRLVRQHRTRESIAKITARTPFGARETGLDGCFARIDPQLRKWLSNTKGGISNVK